ncbi:MAG: PTS sugar transporter subunit IIA [Nitrospirota bacterium]|nr:PTS sugar transporter subunit IIA [Nitrospirota bacterium]
MARIRDLLDDELIIAELKAGDKAGVIAEFAELLAAKGKVRDRDELVRVIGEREAQGSTGIGEGIAIPHAKSSSISEMVVAFGRSSTGVDFHSLDGKPAYLFFVLVSPEDRPAEHLKTLARISRVMRNPALRDELRKSSAGTDMRQLILDEDSKYPNSR